MEIRRLVVESEAANPASRSNGGVSFSGSGLVADGNATPRLLRRPLSMKKAAGYAYLLFFCCCVFIFCAFVCIFFCVNIFISLFLYFFACFEVFFYSLFYLIVYIYLLLFVRFI